MTIFQKWPKVPNFKGRYRHEHAEVDYSALYDLLKTHGAWLVGSAADSLVDIRSEMASFKGDLDFYVPEAQYLAFTLERGKLLDADAEGTSSMGGDKYLSSNGPDLDFFTCGFHDLLARPCVRGRVQHLASGTVLVIQDPYVNGGLDKLMADLKEMRSNEEKPALLYMASHLPWDEYPEKYHTAVRAWAVEVLPSWSFMKVFLETLPRYPHPNVPF